MLARALSSSLLSRQSSEVNEMLPGLEALWVAIADITIMISLVLIRWYASRDERSGKALFEF